MAYDVGSINPSSKYSQSFPAQRQMDGVRIPHLADVIDFLMEPGHEHVRLNVEIKVDLLNTANSAYSRPDRIIETLLALLGETCMNVRTEVQCFDWTVLELLGTKHEATG
ncbi:MAG: hypothetical protein ACJATO_001188, partial [Arenicella sp.]